MKVDCGNAGAGGRDEEPGTSPDARPVIFLMGPTAAGKTRIAVSLAERGSCEIVSVDSALVFRHLDIGTGKPGRDELARAPHRLVDIRDPDERYSAAEFRDDAPSAIADIRASGRVPLLVGGTGLYFRALESGPFGAAARRVRPCGPGSSARRTARDAGDACAAGRVDPASARRIHPNDPQRIERALEVHALTGRSMSELLARGRRGALHGPCAES